MSEGSGIVRQILKQSGLRAKKSFGQNFFANPRKLQEIVDLAQIGKDDLVVEVGPGMGFLTGYLAKAARKVIAVEVDRDMIAFLAKNLGGVPNLEVVEADILKYEPPEEEYRIVANLPYYLSSRFLRRFLSGEVRRPTRLLVMLQREVAEKVTSTETSLLSLSVAAYGDARIVARYKPTDFHPAPEVHSALLAIDVLPAPRLASPEKVFFAVARSAFQSPRKMLSKSLRSQNLLPGALEAVFAEAQVSPSARPATLSLADFDRLAVAIDARRSAGAGQAQQPRRVRHMKRKQQDADE